MQGFVAKVMEKTSRKIWAAKIYDTREEELISLVTIQIFNFF